MTPGARIQATVDLLQEIGHGAAPADEIVAHWARRNRFAGGGDRRAIRDLVFEEIRHRRQLDWWLDRAGAAPLPRLRVIAVLVLVQRWEVARIAAAFGGDRYAAPALSDAERQVVEALAAQPLDHPDQPRDVRLNYPGWLDPMLSASFGDAIEPEMAALSGEATVDLRVNTLKADRAAAERTLREGGIDAAPTPLSPIGLRLAGRVQLAQSKAWRDGLVELQDEGSQIAALLVGARPGETVLDLCAGGGGKALALAAAMENSGRIVACDVSAARLRQGRERFRRAGVSIVEECVLSSDEDPWIVANAGAFDRILVDAPCSGSGAWRRNPDARWRLTPDGLVGLQGQQDRLLASAATLVRPGGRIVYVTCSILREENEARVAAFLGRADRFRVLPVPSVWADSVGVGCPALEDYLKLTPYRHGTDGFFAGVLERE